MEIKEMHNCSRECSRICSLCNMALPVMEFKTRDTKLERVLQKNQYTQRILLNFVNWTNGEPQKLAKIRDFKVDYFILPLFLVPKLRSVAQNEWKKHPYIFFLLLVQK